MRLGSLHKDKEVVVPSSPMKRAKSQLHESSDLKSDETPKTPMIALSSDLDGAVGDTTRKLSQSRPSVLNEKNTLAAATDDDSLTMRVKTGSESPEDKQSLGAPLLATPSHVKEQKRASSLWHD